MEGVLMPRNRSMVPVVATGWVDVKKRADMQEMIASVHQERIKVGAISTLQYHLSQWLIRLPRRKSQRH